MIQRRSTARKRGKRRKPAVRTRLRSPTLEQTLAAIDALQPQSPKAKATFAMLRDWLTDETGYDEEVWPLLKVALDRERSRLGARRLFDD